MAIQDEIIRIHEITAFVKKCFLYCYYFHYPGSADEKKYFDESRDFKFFELILRRTAISEMATLFDLKGDLQTLHLCTFLQQFKAGGDYSLFEFSNPHLIETWEEKLALHQSFIAQLQSISEEIKVKPDLKKINNEVMNLRLMEFKALLQLIDIIVDKLYLFVSGNHLESEDVNVAAGSFLLLRLLEEENRKRC